MNTNRNTSSASTVTGLEYHGVSIKETKTASAVGRENILKNVITIAERKVDPSRQLHLIFGRWTLSHLSFQ